MKSTSFKALFLLLAAPVCTFAQAQPFTLTGKVNPSHDGELVSIAYPLGNATKKDSAVVKNGTFSIEGQIARPEIAYIRMGKVQPANVVDFYLSPGNTLIKATDSLKYSEISGNPVADDFSILQKDIRPLNQKRTALIGKYYALTEEQKKGALGKEVSDAVNEVRNQSAKITNTFIDQHPGSYISLVSLSSMAGSAIDYAETMPRFNKLSPAVKNTPLGKEFEAKLLLSKNMAIGSRVLPFSSTTPEGTTLALKEVLEKGKYTLIDFWASWCGPCRKENPNVVKAFHAYHDKGLNILSVSLDSKADAWKQAIEKDGMPWYHVSGLMGWKEPVAVLYGIEAVPQNLLVDSKGVVVAKNLRAEELFKKLGTLLK